MTFWMHVNSAGQFFYHISFYRQRLLSISRYTNKDRTYKITYVRILQTGSTIDLFATILGYNMLEAYVHFVWIFVLFVYSENWTSWSISGLLKRLSWFSRMSSDNFTGACGLHTPPPLLLNCFIIEYCTLFFFLSRYGWFSFECSNNKIEIPLRFSGLEGFLMYPV